ncbi:hypothetical protein CBR_g363 [Chara braunii]|uniref:Uncharacterized protein n=1 Tax=Chara braunii TaxID=69332 RepID=A0A388JQP9_CHABU|nr:hypothetical protein CBR_g363 [Chara braunii]|eukprot:GBG60032.1 hypothetical protein CBR_g363 [Chara braunii]
MRGFEMKSVGEETFYRFFREEGRGSRQWIRHVERVAEKSYNRIISYLKSSDEPVVILLDDRCDSSQDAQHCTVTAMKLHSRLVVGTETLKKGELSSWRLEKRCVELLLERLTKEKNFVIAEVVHDDCAAVDVVLRNMGIDSQKCIWHKAKSLLKRLREALRGTKTVKPPAVGACEHVREVKMFTKKELEISLRSRGVDVRGGRRAKKKTIVEVVWWELHPSEKGKPLPIDVVENDALEDLHTEAAQELKEWFYGACKLRKRAEDDDGDLLAKHVNHIAHHWADDHSLCVTDIPGLCQAVGGVEREPLYELGGKCHKSVEHCLQQFASVTKMSFYTCARMTYENKCFHSVINKYCSKRLNFAKSYEARVSITALDWNKNRRRSPLGFTYRKESSVGHRRRSARRLLHGPHDGSWRFDISRAVFGTPRVGDWARDYLQQRDSDEGIVDVTDVDVGAGSDTGDEVEALLLRRDKNEASDVAPHEDVGGGSRSPGSPLEPSRLRFSDTSVRDGSDSDEGVDVDSNVASQDVSIA